MGKLKDLLLPLYHQLPPSFRQRRGYRRMHDFYQTAQWWPKKEIEQWQLKRLQMLVQYAYQNVPGYRQLYSEAGIVPEDIRCLADIKKLPYTDKALINNNRNEFASRAMLKYVKHYVTTSGSSGIPFGFYVTKINGAIENAFMNNAWEQTGWRINDRGVVLRGGYIGSEKQLFSTTVKYRTDMSLYYLTAETYPAYRKLIQKTRPSFLHAYPSSAADLAGLVISAGDQGSVHFNSIFIGSENLYKWQIAKIKKAFPAAKLMAWYGHSEQAIWAPWCEKSEIYHVCPFYGFLEVIGEGDKEVSEGETGEIVGTSMWMQATPFIRYRTMDYASKGPAFCPHCGRNYNLLNSIEGRLQEMIISRLGRRISMTAINMHDRTFDNVAQFRFVQRTQGDLVFKFAPRVAFSDINEQNIVRAIREKLGKDFTLRVEKVGHIPRNGRGKSSFLEQHLKIDHADHTSDISKYEA
jgi:phenylacetate-CoA ligase